MRQSLGHIHADVDHQVAISSAITLHSRQTLAPEAHRLARLSATLHLHLQCLAIDGGDVHLATQGCCGEVEQQVVYQVVAVSYEGVVLFLLDIYLDVASYAAMMSSITLAGHIDHHTLGHASGNIDFYDLFTLGHTRATTFMTLVLNDLTFTVTGGAYALSLHHSEDALCGVGDDARSVTSRTCLSTAAVLGASAVTVGASDVLAHLELLGDARIDFLQGEAYLQTQVAASVHLGTTAPATTESAKAVTTEDIAEHREDVVHIHRRTVETTESACSASHRTCEAKLIVLLTLLRVVQDVVGLGSLLKLLLSLFVARVSVGVIFDGNLSICLLDVVFRGRLVQSQHLVVVSFLCHAYCPTATLA